MRIFRLTTGILFVLIILTGCTSERVPKIESIDNILNCPMLFRNGTYTNPYPAIELDSIEVLPVYASKWNDEKGVEELNTFLNEFDIDEHDGIVYSNESCVRYISDDAFIRFDSSYHGIGFTYAVDPYPETLIDINTSYFEYSFLPDSSGVNISETAEKELCYALTTYINSHKDLFGSADKLNITDAQIWSSFREKMILGLCWNVLISTRNRLKIYYLIILDFVIILKSLCFTVKNRVVGKESVLTGIQQIDFLKSAHIV